MDITEIKAGLDRAANLLLLEEVEYALGLHSDHLDHSFKVQEVEKTDRYGNKYVAEEEVPLTDEDVENEIKAHREFADSIGALAGRVEAMHHALKVVTSDLAITRYLRAHDPQALEQAVQALL